MEDKIKMMKLREILFRKSKSLIGNKQKLKKYRKKFKFNNNKINETQIYRSNDILNSLDLMHRICK